MGNSHANHGPQPTLSKENVRHIMRNVAKLRKIISGNRIWTVSLAIDDSRANLAHRSSQGSPYFPCYGLTSCSRETKNSIRELLVYISRLGECQCILKFEILVHYIYRNIIIQYSIAVIMSMVPLNHLRPERTWDGGRVYVIFFNIG